MFTSTMNSISKLESRVSSLESQLVFRESQIRELQGWVDVLASSSDDYSKHVGRLLCESVFEAKFDFANLSCVDLKRSQPLDVVSRQFSSISLQIQPPSAPSPPARLPSE